MEDEAKVYTMGDLRRDLEAEGIFVDEKGAIKVQFSRSRFMREIGRARPYDNEQYRTGYKLPVEKVQIRYPRYDPRMREMTERLRLKDILERLNKVPVEEVNKERAVACLRRSAETNRAAALKLDKLADKLEGKDSTAS